MDRLIGGGPTPESVEAPRARTRTVGELLTDLALDSPHAQAIVSPHGDRTFAELDGQSEQVAAALLAAGVRKGDVVALLAPNTPTWLEVMAGAARIGAVIVPLNTWYKDDEIRWVLRHSHAKVLISVDRVRNQDLHASIGRVAPSVEQPYAEQSNGRLTDPNVPDLERIVALGERRHRGSLSYDEFLDAGTAALDLVAEHAASVTPEDPLYLLYTSGSTARPKGVLLLHGYALENAWHIGQRQGVEPVDRTWLVQPLFWALGGVNMLFSSWTHGSSVVLQDVFDAEEGLRTIERYGATRAYAIGNISQALLAHPYFPDADLTTLRKGVALFSPADRRIASERLGMDIFVSIYGSTEMHAVSFSENFSSPLEERLASNGTTLPGWEAQLVRPGTDERVHDGEGELVVRGRLSPGYFEDLEQTAAAFDADGWFHTGDLVSVDEFGRLEFLARITEMIKTGGINVAPPEVEDVLARCPGVRSAHVFAMPDPVKGEVVAAVVVPDGPRAVTPASVRDWVAGRAAAYKVPARVVLADEDQLPRLPTGKIAKRRLHELMGKEA